LHETGVAFIATLDRETLIDRVLQTIVQKLSFDRAMITFYDAERSVIYDARLVGVSEDLKSFARSMETRITDPFGIEGQIFLQGKAMIIADVREVMDKLSPFSQRLVTLTETTSFIAVPLKVKDRIIGSLTVACRQQSLKQEDLELLMTIGSQLAIALDNADAYRMIEELNIGLEKKVRERTLALEQFLARVSHDLRTPLTSMKGFAENMLIGLVGPLTDKQRQYLTRMIANGGRLARLVDDLLDMLVDPDRVELSFTDFNLSALICEVVEQLRPLATAKSQQFEVKGCEETIIVSADVDKLSRILTNLIDNAIKYTERDGAVQVTVRKDEGNCAYVSVRDTGGGIPPEALPNIFDPALRLTPGHARGVSSHGLGLSIVKDLVERHGGKITVESEMHRGTVFTFTIPIPGARDKMAASALPEVKRILVVDDDPDIRQL
jgi:signal transduction histidine kinase